MGQKGVDRQIDNIEFAVADIARSKAFYGTAFGWSFTDYGPQLLRVQRRPADWRLDNRNRQARAWPAGDPVCRTISQQRRRGWRGPARAS